MMAYEIAWEPEGVVICYSGFVTARELIESANKIQADPRFDDMQYVIDDLLELKGCDLSKESFLDLAAANYGAYASNPNCRIAYVTKDVGLSQIIKETLMMPGLSSYEVEVKPTVSEARDWLSSKPRLQEISSTMGLSYW
jgi:hypothetical protein